MIVSKGSVSGITLLTVLLLKYKSPRFRSPRAHIFYGHMGLESPVSMEQS